MRRLLAAVSGLAVGVLTVLPGAAAAHAAPVLSADLQVSASQVSGHIGNSVEIRLVVRNNGPNAVLPETWTLAFQAPPGTRLGGGSALAGNCDQGDRQAQCRYGFGLRRGERHDLKLGLWIQSQPSGCGRVEVAYGLDPRARNNSVPLRVTVDGKPSSCSTRISPSPSPKESPTPSATPEAEVTEVPSDQPPASADVLPAYQSDEGGGLGLASILVIGGGLMLVALGGVLIWRLLRRENDDDYEDDPTGPIYGR
jgi:hypothetical protein